MAVEDYNCMDHLLQFMLVSKMLKVALCSSVASPPFWLPACTETRAPAPLKKCPALGTHIRLLFIDPAPIPDKTLLPILATAPNLRKFGGSFRDNESMPVFYESAMDGGLARTRRWRRWTAPRAACSWSSPRSSCRTRAARAPRCERTTRRCATSCGYPRRAAMPHARAPRVAPRREVLAVLPGAADEHGVSESDPDGVRSLSRAAQPRRPAARVAAQTRGRAAMVAFLQWHAGKLCELRAPLEVLIQLKPFAAYPRLASPVFLASYTMLKAERRAPKSSTTLGVQRFPALRKMQVADIRGEREEQVMQLAEALRAKNVALTDADGKNFGHLGPAVRTKIEENFGPKNPKSEPKRENAIFAVSESVGK
ncbi:hypothetical protein B0H10DRAFT_1964789 [Mycena sp. CBHHK59/15]|nr:hypothetical protein B0H10DRAFT_1964789 [Mycena sp. CBHHK59/15]